MKKKIGLVVLLFSSTIFANDKRLFVSKYYGKAANGECVKKVQPFDKASIDNIVDHHNLKILGQPLVKDVSDKKNYEVHAFAEVIQAMSNIGDGRFKLHHEAKVAYVGLRPKPYTSKCIKIVKKYNKMFWEKINNKLNANFRIEGCQARTSSSCEGNTLVIHTGAQGQRAVQADPVRSVFAKGRNNSAHIAHEIAHCFGHKNIEGKRLYDKYFEAVSPRCLPTRYCERRGNRNEEFADVFALYLMYPDILQERKECHSAIKFFAKLFGENKDYKSITCENRNKQLNSFGHFSNNQSIIEIKNGN